MIVFVVVCTDLPGKDLHRQVGVDRIVTSWHLGGVMVSSLAQNARDVGSRPTLGTIFPIFITSMGVMGIILNKLCAV